jgi:hypothetical protein
LNSAEEAVEEEEEAQGSEGEERALPAARPFLSLGTAVLAPFVENELGRWEEERAGKGALRMGMPLAATDDVAVVCILCVFDFAPVQAPDRWRERGSSCSLPPTPFSFPEVCPKYCGPGIRDMDTTFQHSLHSRSCSSACWMEAVSGGGREEV